MSIARSQLIADAREHADATGSTRWADATLIRFADTVFRREWSNILNANRFYRQATRTATIGAGGIIASGALNGGAGDTAENFYRAIVVAVGTQLYREIEQDRVPGLLVNPDASSIQPIFWMQGEDQVVVRPANVGQDVTVVVNHYPALPSELATDGSMVVFPRGYDLILSLELGALMLMKGGAETPASVDLQRQAEAIRQDMLADIGRRTTKPLEMRYSDSALEWAS